MFRRASALRSEIETQITAMREGLMALHAQALDAAGFAELAGSAREVATEAVPQTTTRAPTLRRGSTASLIAPAVLSK